MITGAPLPPLCHTHRDTVGGEGGSTMTKLNRIWTATDTYKSKEAAKTIQNPGDSDP